MNKITASEWQTYIEKLSAVNKKAADLMREYIGRHGIKVDKELIDFAHAIAVKYGEAAAELACQMYDEIAAVHMRNNKTMIPPAEPAEVPTAPELAKILFTTFRRTPFNMPEAIETSIKRVAADTTLKNAIRDGAEWAWIPSGDTCPFCLMLAGNGWHKASKNILKNGHASHIHVNCDCNFAVRLDMFTDVEGYEPGKYFDMINDSPGNKTKDKMNALRRKQYAENKDFINEQKRLAYRRRKEVSDSEG